MERIPRGTYTKEFQEEASKLVVEGGMSILEAGRRLSLAPSTLAYRVKAYKGGKLQEVGKLQKPQSEIEMELSRVKRELAEARMERDFLKKRQHTLQRSRGEVCVYERDEAPIFYTVYEPDIKGIGEWILCMV